MLMIIFSSESTLELSRRQRPRGWEGVWPLASSIMCPFGVDTSSPGGGLRPSICGWGLAFTTPSKMGLFLLTKFPLRVIYSIIHPVLCQEWDRPPPRPKWVVSPTWGPAQKKKKKQKRKKSNSRGMKSHLVLATPTYVHIVQKGPKRCDSCRY